MSSTINNSVFLIVANVAIGYAAPSGGQPTVPELISSFSDADREAAALIADKISQRGSSATGHLVSALESRDPIIRRGVFLTLQQLGAKAKKAVPALTRLTTSTDSLNRRGAIYALGAMGNAAKPAIANLIEALAHEDFHTQYAACRALGNLGEIAEPAIPILIQLTQTGLTSVRRHAAAALGGVGPAIGDDGLQALVDALADRSQAVREQAVIAMGRLPEIAKATVPKIEQLLRTGKLKARPLAIRSIWQLTGDTDRAVAMLVDELHDVQTQLMACMILEEMGYDAKGATEALLEMTESEDPDCRIKSMQALVRIAPNRASVREALRRLRKDADEYVREVSAKITLPVSQ